MNTIEVNHPLIKHKLGLMRKGNISTKHFRELASEVGTLLTYEATKNLELETTTIDSWNGPIEVEQIKGKKITVVPILRAGLGMMDGVLELIPSARISVVGMYRNEETFEPVFYFEKLAAQIDERLALVIDPMLATGGSMVETINLLKEKFQNQGFTKIVGTEARGFLFGAPLALALGVGFVPVRKPGKLPRATFEETYQLEYGVDALEIHQDALTSEDNVLIVDDLLATGGTIGATMKLIQRLGAKVEDAAFVISLPDLGGEKKLIEQGLNVFSLLEYEGD